MKKVSLIEYGALPAINSIITLACSESPKSGDVIYDRNNVVAYRINCLVYSCNDAEQTVDVHYAVTII